MRVLMLESDATVSECIRKRLKEAKVPMDVLEEPEQAVGAAEGAYDSYTAILVGSVEDPVETVKALRLDHKTVPIFVLADFKNTEQAIETYNVGSDGYIVKPFNPHELVARAKSVGRRVGRVTEASLQLGRLTVHLDGRDPEVDGKRIKLSQREHAIFLYLVQNLGRVVSKESVYTAVYGMVDCEPFEKVIDVYICKLRKKLAEPTGGQQFIETVYCRGYKFDKPENTVVQRLGSGGRKSAKVVESRHRRAA